MTTRILRLSFPVFLFFFSCSAQKPLVVTEEANGTTLTVKRNASFTIALEANPSTGYSWNVVSLDTAAVMVAGDPRFAARDSMPGSSGTSLLDFKAVGKGSTRIKLAYFRSWEKEIAPEDSFSVIIAVQ